MSDKNNNGLPDAAEEAVENAVKNNYGKILSGAGLVAVLVTGVSVAVKWNEFVAALAKPQIESAVRLAIAKKDVYLNARQNQVTCLEGFREPDECKDIYEEKVEEGLEQLKEE